MSDLAVFMDQTCQSLQYQQSNTTNQYEPVHSTGMLKAIQEAGIPVDRVGGVSMGAFVGGLWGVSRDMAEATQKARRLFDLLNRILGPVLDLTYPITSLFSGKYFNWTLTETFGTDLDIEDLWLPFFCCSTDITVSQVSKFLLNYRVTHVDLDFGILVGRIG